MLPAAVIATVLLMLWLSFKGPDDQDPQHPMPADQPVRIST